MSDERRFERSEDQDTGGELDDTTEALRIIGEEEGEPPLRFAEDVTGELPHWTEPPTGELPRLFGEASSDDLDAWSSFSSQPLWRDDRGGDADATMDDLMDLREQLMVGALDEGRAEPLFGDLPEPEPFAELDQEPEPVAPTKVTIGGGRTERPAARAGRAARPEVDTFTATRGTGGRNMSQAVLVGLAIAAVAVAAFTFGGPDVTVALVTVIIVACAVEFFTVVRAAGHHPATLVGLVAVAALPAAAYNRGEAAISLVVVLSVFGALLWFMFVDRDAPPLAGTGVTMLGVVYLGVLGGFAGLLLGFPANTDHILAVAIATVTYDVVGLLAGSSLGRTRMAPSISPNKTWEGTIVGIVAAVIMSVIVTGSIVDPWSQNLAHPLQLGLVCAIAAALGDLASSMLKRDLKVKDWGNLLPGHGGAMDRFSGFLFALPAAYYLSRLLNVY